MKYIFMLLTILLGTVYGLLFTSFGNDFLKPVLEKQIQKETKLDTKLKLFQISLSNLHIKIDLTPDNSIDINGSFSLIEQNFNISYNILLNKLKKLKPLTKTDLNGNFKTNGTIIGNLKSFNIVGLSNIANSKTTYKTKIVDLYPSSIFFKSKNLDLKTLLFMVNQKKYASAKIDIDMDIKNPKMNHLDGKISLLTKNGNFNKKILFDDYNISLPQSNFKLSTTTKLIDNKALTAINFTTKIANLYIKEAKLNLTSQELTSDYKIKIANLNNLFFITKTKLKGSFVATGKIVKNDDIIVDFHSNTCGGQIVAKLKNNKLTSDIKNLNTLKLLDMLMYPKIFNSTLNAKLNYNLQNKKGNFNGTLKNGKFQKNTVLNLVKQYARTNLYIENFNGKIKADIAPDKVISSLYLSSNNSSISSKNAKINLKQKRVSASVDIVANKNPLNFKINGDINNPNIKINANKLIEKEAKKAIGKFLNIPLF